MSLGLAVRAWLGVGLFLLLKDSAAHFRHSSKVAFSRGYLLLGPTVETEGKNIRSNYSETSMSHIPCMIEKLYTTSNNVQ